MDKLEKAMEKAETLRQRTEAVPSIEAFSPEPIPRSKAETGEDLNPAYKYTRIVDVDPGILRKNRIVALFHDQAATDQIKTMRTQVMEKMEGINGRSLLVTSAHGREGKTLTAVNLAVSISHQINRTVLLVDADFKKPSVHRYFGLENEKGLADFLQRSAEIPELLVNPGIQKLVLLPAGKPPKNSAELLASPRMQSLTQEMSRRYLDRFIIFDTPDLLSSTDALVLSQFVDGILLVVEAEKTSSKDIRHAMDLLRDRPLIGTVLNRYRN